MSMETWLEHSIIGQVCYEGLQQLILQGLFLSFFFFKEIVLQPNLS